MPVQYKEFFEQPDDVGLAVCAGKMEVVLLIYRQRLEVPAFGQNQRLVADQAFGNEDSRHEVREIFGTFRQNLLVVAVQRGLIALNFIRQLHELPEMEWMQRGQYGLQAGPGLDENHVHREDLGAERSDAFR